MTRFIIYTIILSTSLFSSTNYASANQGLLSDILELSTGIEAYKLENIPKLQTRSFSNKAVQNTYSEFFKIDRKLRDEFMKQYRQGKIDTYQIQDLITSYGNFVYHTDRLFLYISINEKGTRGTEIEQAISDTYSQMRMSYARVQSILR